MKTALLILAVAACCAGNGCTPKGGPGADPSENELLIYEVVVRNLAAGHSKGELILVSFGESWTDHVDPPESFFESLADVHVSLRPVSQFDRLSNPNALLYVVHLVEWATETEAKVSVTRFRFGVGASDGFTAGVAWTDGDWTVVSTTGHWST